MLTEIAVVEETVAGLSTEAFAQSPQALRAVLYSLAAIGEAVASITDELEKADAVPPWQQFAACGMPSSMSIFELMWRRFGKRFSWICRYSKQPCKKFQLS